MPNDTDHKIRVVAEAFMGWKPCIWARVPNGVGNRCETHDSYSMMNRCQDGPPLLLEPAGAWALLMALLDKGYSWDANREDEALYVFLRGSLRASVRICGYEENLSKDLATALLDAAYQLATKEQQ